jgi:outer membrane protein OmpA-like peptidoglycan-associated protein
MVKSTCISLIITAILSPSLLCAQVCAQNLVKAQGVLIYGQLPLEAEKPVSASQTYRLYTSPSVYSEPPPKAAKSSRAEQSGPVKQAESRSADSGLTNSGSGRQPEQVLQHKLYVPLAAAPPAIETAANTPKKQVHHQPYIIFAPQSETAQRAAENPVIVPKHRHPLVKPIKIQGFVSMVIPADRLFIGENHVLSLEADAILLALLDELDCLGEHPVRIEVHTDALGFANHNDKLSAKRAQEISNWFTRHAKGHRLNLEACEIVGMGGTKPIAPNKDKEGKDYPAGRAQNRRMEVKVNTTVAYISPAMLEKQEAALAAEQAGGKTSKAKASSEEEDMSDLPPELQEVRQILKGVDGSDMDGGGADGVSDASAGTMNVQESQESQETETADGKRKAPVLSEADKNRIKEERDWARQEFGLFNSP